MVPASLGLGSLSGPARAAQDGTGHLTTNGVRAQIFADTAIVDQSAMRHPSSRRVTVAERPG